MTAVALSERTEFANYVYDSEHTVDVLITLQAEKREQDVNRAAVCLSTTIDKSGSMKERLPLVKQTMTFLLLQLMDEDKLGIVTYDTNVNETLPLSVMDAEGKRKSESEVQKIVSGTATNLSGGLFQSIQQLKDAFQNDGNPGPINAVMLLTDGLANHGITDRNLLKETVINALKEGPPIVIHTFGYGEDHDEDLLRDIAIAGGGNYYYMKSDEDVPTSFADALGGLISVIAQNAVVEISPSNPSVTIENVFTGFKIEEKPDGMRKLSASDLYSEERKDILVRLKVPAVSEPVDAEPLLNVHFSYFDIQAASKITTESVVCIKRPSDPPGEQIPDEEIVMQQMYIGYVGAVNQAQQYADMGNFDVAQIVMEQHREDITYRRRFLTQAAPRMARMMVQCSEAEQIFQHPEAYIEGGRKKATANVHAYKQQRGSVTFQSDIQRTFCAGAASFVKKSTDESKELSLIAEKKEDAV